MVFSSNANCKCLEIDATYFMLELRPATLGSFRSSGRFLLYATTAEVVVSNAAAALYSKAGCPEPWTIATTDRTSEHHCITRQQCQYSSIVVFRLLNTTSVLRNQPPLSLSLASINFLEQLGRKSSKLESQISITPNHSPGLST